MAQHRGQCRTIIRKQEQYIYIPDLNRSDTAE